MKIAAIEIARQFSMIVLIAFIIERHFGRRIPSRLMRPTISKPWNEKKEKRKKKEKKRETKKKKKTWARRRGRDGSRLNRGADRTKIFWGIGKIRLTR